MRTITVAVSLTIWMALSTTMAVAQEPADAPETRPVVLIDAAHHNVYSAAHRASIIEFLEKDGYRVREVLRGRFDRESPADNTIVNEGEPGSPWMRSSCAVTRW